MPTPSLFEPEELGLGAVLSPCRTYRYLLTRQWGSGPMLNFIMLNPSTAAETENDPTITRCIERAKRRGFGSLQVTNLFAFRATEPAEMKRAAEPIGPNNDGFIVLAARAAKQVVLAWGVDGKHLKRGPAVCDLLWAHGVELYCLGLTGKGEPVHPLYQDYGIEFRPYVRPASPDGAR